MINKDNLKQVLKKLNFQEIKENYFSKKFKNFDCNLEVDFQNKKLIYPENAGLKINDKTTSNFSSNENFVVFECVNRLFEQGYNPKHIELEPKWQVGHGASGGKADILVKDNSGNSYLIIECKTAGGEFNNAWKQTKTKPTQIFSYAQQAKSTQFIALYASDLVDNEVRPEYYLISLKDNQDLLKNNSKLKSFKEAGSVEEIYKVWKETYDGEYARLGLFENNRAYEIGKDKFSLDDLKTVSSKDIAGKYHEFATILRQHNVSGRENAFDKLINLFLCKVVDEKDNSQDLQFYWKGKAYDDPFSLQDRLQKLYSVGMKKFLGEDITYIDNNQIDQAFRMFKNKNATKKVIKEYFKQLKFFTNNDFAFIDIHNEKLFYQNFAVFLKIIRAFQDISLTGGEENQFLGDMFEGFLDQGVKQSEGQFFTPMPIVKFIINSLPDKQNPTVIDYACGAGHFLNEYASKNKGAKVLGIEKEYRLSKVSKVSAFMYGNDDMQIIYDDALAQNKKLENESFDVLVANPPYSVKGFLETLKEEDREKYELTQEINKKSYSSNNAIECFFLEKSAHLLKTGGVAGIIVPSSILNKGNKVYSKTREIILKNFSIVAIYESGSGTFGKTGTNTVTLFLKKKETKPSFAEHFKNMVNWWFEGDFKTNEENFKYNELLKKYCSHQEYDFEEYKEFLSGKLGEKILENEIFKEYKTHFEKLSTTKNYKKKPFYKNLSKEEKENYDKKEFLKFAYEIEKDKLLYFGIASDNESKVLIVKTPSGNSEIKKFLGYEWSSGKGNEGIKYLASANVNIEDEEEELEEDDKRVLENISSLDNIETPLYNPKNLDDESKINYLIKKNFEGENSEISEDLQKFVNKSNLTDMLDFSRVGFDKAISLNPKKLKPIESNNFKQVNFKELFLEIKNGKNVKQFDEEGKYKVSRIESIAKGVFDKDAIKWTNDNVKESDFLEKGDILFSHINSVKHLGKTALFDIDEKIVHGVNLLKFKPNKEKILSKYAIELFKLDSFKSEIENQAQKAVNQASVNTSYLSELYFPLPPLDIQEKIVNECEKIDLEVEKAESEIKESNGDIEKIVGNVDGEMVKIENIVDKIDSGKRPKLGVGNFENGALSLGGEHIHGTNGRIFIKNKKYVPLEFYEKSKNGKLETNDILICKDGAKTGKIALLRNELNGEKAMVNEHVFIIRNNDINKQKYIFNFLFSKTGQELLKSNITGSAQGGLNSTNLKNIKIPLPSLEKQKEIVGKIEEIEKKIDENRKIIEGAKELKEGVLRRYL